MAISGCFLGSGWDGQGLDVTSSNGRSWDRLGEAESGAPAEGLPTSVAQKQRPVLWKEGNQFEQGQNF